MANKAYFVNYGAGVTVLPSAAAERILNGNASLTDVRVLTAVLSEYGKREVTLKSIASATGLAETSVEGSIAFWRGVGAIGETEAATVSEDGAKDVSGNAIVSEVKPERESRPKYTGAQLSELLGKDGGQIKEMIDICQQVMGRIFNTVETSTMVSLCDWLGLSSEYVVTLCQYFVGKKPGCTVRYIEKAATDLVNRDIVTLDDLDAYLKEMELYDGIAGKLRSWLGIGSRAYTQKENAMIKRWASDFAYGEDTIKYAYEITVDAKGAFNFDYANAILENWYTSGVRSKEDAERAVERYRSEKENKKKTDGSFDTDEFFGLALKRSYKRMAGEK